MSDKNWTKEQKDAIYKEADNILVSASAGSGKTAVLVERVINKVIKKGVDIDKILVVTFTNAAALELKDRLLSRIYKSLEQNPNDMFLKKQITLLNRASITTIHSFCLDLIRTNFEVLDIDPLFNIADESQINFLKQRAISKILDREYENNSNIKDDLTLGIFKVLELFSGKEEDFLGYILRLYSYIQSFEYPFFWLDNQIEKYNIDENLDLFNTEFGKQIYVSAIDELKLIVKKIDILQSRICNNEDFIKYYDMLEEDLENIKKCLKNSNNSWDKLYNLLSSISFSRMPSYKGQNIKLKDEITTFRKKVIKEGIEKIKRGFYADSKKIINDNKNAYKYLKYIQNILLEFNKEYSKLKREKNVIDFNDIEHLALELLVVRTNDGGIINTSIADELKNRYVEVYTDEYQDTSYIQEAILEAVSGSKNRFMVGDIKQSIYKFRQAMPEIFNLKYDEYDDLDEKVKENAKNIKIELLDNFRSRKGVLDSINYIFDKIMTSEIGDCNYNNKQALKAGSDLPKLQSNNYKTEINILELKKEEDNNSTYDLVNDEVSIKLEELKKIEIEAAAISNRIKKLKNEFKVYNGDSFNNLKYKDIAILLRSTKDSGKIIEDVLRKEKIPAFCDTSTNIFDSEEVNLVLSFLQILDNPYQDIPLVSVMYSIIGRFSLDDLVYIRNINQKDFLYNNIKDTMEFLNSKEKHSDYETILLDKINSFLELINRFYRYSKIYSVSDVLTKLYRDTNIYMHFLSDNMPLYRRANLDLLVEIATKLPNDTAYTLSSYVTYIKNLKDKNDVSTGAAKILGENEDVVRIMTIHKSKGLEFPVVILADTSKKYNLKDSTASIIMHHKLGIGINIINEELKVTYPGVVKQAIKQKIIKETKSEELRMLYVALTRAKEKLIIFGSIDDYEKKCDKSSVIVDDNCKIEPKLILNNNSYLDNMLSAINIGNTKVNDIFDINVNNVRYSDGYIDTLLNKKDSSRLSISERVHNIQKQNISSKNIIKKKEYIDIIENNIYNEYYFKDDINVQNRVSVTSLKEGSNALVNKNNIEGVSRTPILSMGNKANVYLPVRKGILIHFILEHLDFSKKYNKETIILHINGLVERGVISTDDLKYIDTEKLLTFLESNLYTDILKSKRVYKEEEFILKDNSFTKSTIQGIIDLYYLTDDEKIVLVDFKTDKSKDINYYIEKYSKQLDIYKEALEKLTEKEVVKTCIYSFEIGREIEI